MTSQQKELIEHFEPRDRGAGRVAVDILPDDVLLDIFDFYRTDAFEYPWIWHTLVQVCRRWRQIIFASSSRLELQLLCKPHTRMRELLPNLLDFLPPMPIRVCNWCKKTLSDSFITGTVSLGDGSPIIAALEKYDYVQTIELLDLPGSVLKKVATTMQETFPNLKYVRLEAGDGIAPVLPESFLGGSAPLLETFWLMGIPFPELPRILLSTTNLVQLELDNIPDSGFFSPEAMITSLSTCTKLETLIMEFLSPHPHPDLTSQQNTSLARAYLPALALFHFRGNGGYLRILFSRIENPLVMLHSTISADKFVDYKAYLSPPELEFFYQYHLLERLVPVGEELGEEE